MNWWHKLYRMTPANPPKSMTGCLVANVFLVLVLFAILYFAGLPIAWLQ